MFNFKQYNKATKIVIPDKIQLPNTDFSNAFKSMNNIQTLDINNDNITNISKMCEGLSNLVGNAYCGNNVTNMASAYNYC